MLNSLKWTKADKRVLLIAASILAARKLAQFDGGKKVPATMRAIADAVRRAEEIMKAIDERWTVIDDAAIPALIDAAGRGVVR